MKLPERELEILNCLVRGWEVADYPLASNISYEEILDWLESVGANKPTELVKQLEHLKQLSKDSEDKKKQVLCWLCHKPIEGKVYYQGESYQHPVHKGCRFSVKRSKDGGI